MNHSPDELEKTRARPGHRRVRVAYFALLRERAGCAVEDHSTASGTIAELYTELSARHGFHVPMDRVRAAVGETFVATNTPLRYGDEILFIPPVAGG